MTPRRDTWRPGPVVLVIVLAACREGGEAPRTGASPGSSASPVRHTMGAVHMALEEATERARARYAGLSFEEFKRSDAVYKEPFEGGKYIVNGDTPILDEKQLREFFEKNVKVPPPPPTELIVHSIGGVDAVWDQQTKRKLAYCISRQGLGPRYDAVVADMAAATGAWEQVAAVDFTHDTTQDDQCTASNPAVVFDVRGVDVGGEYLARAFFPNEPRSARNVLIDQTALSLGADERPQLVGILRHELGHALGFRHEHTRPNSGRCFEDTDWSVLTEYDPYSVMHYPQCNGRGDWSLTLTDRDKSGAACLYAAAPSFTIDPMLVDPTDCQTEPPASPAGAPTTQSFDGQSVQKDAQVDYGPFPVVPGSLFVASMGGPGASGDPDLYVRFGAKPAIAVYDCRPYLAVATETCSLDVPAGTTQAFVMVRGYAAGQFALKVTHVPPAS
jgi:serine protease